MNSFLALDTETTTINKGDPYHPDNRLVSIGLYTKDWYKEYYKEFNINELQNILNQHTIILFNGKFDLAWLRNIGIHTDGLSVRDVQLAEFLLTNQQTPYPSLDNCAEKYLNKHKIDNIKLNYWDKGIDTWFIPQDELSEYLKEDCKLTYELYLLFEQQLKKQNKYNLFLLQCADLVELHLMEYAGIFFDKEESVRKGLELEQTITKHIEHIKSYTKCPSFNPSSGDHLSALLYGGTITHIDRIPVGVYKTGLKAGQSRYKIFKTDYVQERLVEPIKGSELKKEGYWSVDHDTLVSLKAKGPIKKLIESILEINKLEKLKSTYYLGIPKLMDERKWKGNMIHGQFNQVVARTGRLSSKEPNLQNFDPEIKKLCISRYEI